MPGELSKFKTLSFPGLNEVLEKPHKINLHLTDMSLILIRAVEGKQAVTSLTRTFPFVGG